MPITRPPGRARPVADPERHLATEHLRADLPRRTVRAGALAVAAQAVRIALTAVSTVVLARLLTPEDYGLVAMVTALTGFLVLFRDMGLTQATIQRPSIAQAEASALFWINAGMGLLLLLVTTALAPALAWFYREPRLLALAPVLSISFLMGGLAAQHQALLTRQMRLGAVAAADLGSLLAGTAVGIAIALRSGSWWAIAGAHVTSAAMHAALVWWLSGWRPDRPRRTGGLRSFIAFGGPLTGFNVVNYFARNLDNVLIGRFLGAVDLGLYSKAYNLLLLPLQAVNNPLASVAQPGLSRLQEEPAKFREFYLRALALVTTVTIPAVPFLILVSREVIGLILGPRWMEAAAIFTILGVLVLVQPVCNTAGWLYIATGRTARLLRWGVFGSSLTVLAFAAGLPWGVRGVAWAYTVMSLALTVPCMWYATRGLPITLRDLLEAVRPQLLAAAAAGGACWWAREAARGAGLPGWGVIACALGALLLTYALLLLLPPGRRGFYRSVLRHLGGR